MNESVTDEGRRQSILKLRPRLPLQEVPCFFPDDDTTTITRSRRVSFGRNLIKEFIVGSAASTKAYDEYEQSSESISEPSDCSGPLDLALNKSCANLELDSPCVSRPELLTESGEGESDQRVRLFTEGCIHLAKSVFDGGDGMTAAIIINAKPAVSEEDRRNASSVSYTNLDLSHFQDSSSGPGHLSPKSVSQLERVRREEPDFVPMRHNELFNTSVSGQFSQSRFDFLSSPAGGLSQRPCLSQSFAGARQEPRKAFARLSQPAALWRSEEEENIPPTHGMPHHRPPVAHQQVLEMSYVETVEFTSAGRVEPLSMFLDESMDETLPSMQRQCNQSDMEETVGRPLHGGIFRQSSKSDVDETISRGGSQSDMEQTMGRPFRNGSRQYSQSDMEETMGRPLKRSIPRQGSQSDMEETMGRPLIGVIHRQGSQSDMEETIGRPLIGGFPRQGSQSDMEETMGRPLTQQQYSQSDMEETVGRPLTFGRVALEGNMSGFLNQSESYDIDPLAVDPLANDQQGDLSFLPTENTKKGHVDIVLTRDHFLSNLDSEDENEEQGLNLGPAANDSQFNLSGFGGDDFEMELTETASRRPSTYRQSDLADKSIAPENIDHLSVTVSHNQSGYGGIGTSISHGTSADSESRIASSSGAASGLARPSAQNENDFEMELTQTSSLRRSTFKQTDLADESVAAEDVEANHSEKALHHLLVTEDPSQSSYGAIRTSISQATSVDFESETVSGLSEIRTSSTSGLARPSTENENDLEMELTQTSSLRRSTFKQTDLADESVAAEDVEANHRKKALHHLLVTKDPSQSSYGAIRTSISQATSVDFESETVSGLSEIRTSSTSGLARPSTENENDLEMELTQTSSLRRSTHFHSDSAIDADQSIATEEIALSKDHSQRSFISNRSSIPQGTIYVPESEPSSGLSEICTPSESLARPSVTSGVEDDFEMELTETASRRSLVPGFAEDLDESSAAGNDEEDLCLSTAQMSKSFNRSRFSSGPRTSIAAEILAEPRLESLSVASVALRQSIYKHDVTAMDVDQSNATETVGAENYEDDEVVSSGQFPRSVDQLVAISISICQDSRAENHNDDDVYVMDVSSTDHDLESKAKELEPEPNECVIIAVEPGVTNEEEPLKEASFLADNLPSNSFLLEENASTTPQVLAKIDSSCTPQKIHEALAVFGEKTSKCNEDEVAPCEIDEALTMGTRTNNLSFLSTSCGAVNPEAGEGNSSSVSESLQLEPTQKLGENQVPEKELQLTPSRSESADQAEPNFTLEAFPKVVEVAVDHDISQSSTVRGSDAPSPELDSAIGTSIDQISPVQENVLTSPLAEDVSINQNTNDPERMETSLLARDVIGETSFLQNLSFKVVDANSSVDDLKPREDQQNVLSPTESEENESGFKEDTNVQKDPIAGNLASSQDPHLTPSPTHTDDNSHNFDAMIQQSVSVTAFTTSLTESASTEDVEDTEIVPPGRRATYCVKTTPQDVQIVTNEYQDMDSVQLDRRVTYCVPTTSQDGENVQDVPQDSKSVQTDRRVTYCMKTIPEDGENVQDVPQDSESVQRDRRVTYCLQTTPQDGQIARDSESVETDRRVTYCVKTTPHDVQTTLNVPQDSECIQLDRRVTYCVQTSSQLVEDGENVIISQAKRTTYCVPQVDVAAEQERRTTLSVPTIDNNTGLESTLGENKTFDVDPVKDRRGTYCVAKGQSDLLEMATPEKMNQTQSTFTINNAEKRFLNSPCVGEGDWKKIRPSNSPMVQPRENIIAEEEMEVDSGVPTDLAHDSFTDFMSHSPDTCPDGVNSFLSLNDITLGSGATPVRASNVSSTSERRSFARSLQLSSPAREDNPVSSTDLSERAMVCLDSTSTQLPCTETHPAGEDVSTNALIETHPDILEEVATPELGDKERRDDIATETAEFVSKETLEGASVHEAVVMDETLTEQYGTETAESALKEMLERSSLHEAVVDEPLSEQFGTGTVESTSKEMFGEASVHEAIVMEETLSEPNGTETAESTSKEIFVDVPLQETSMVAEVLPHQYEILDEAKAIERSTENAVNDLTSSLKKRLSLSSQVGENINKAPPSDSLDINNMDCVPMPSYETSTTEENSFVAAVCPSTSKETLRAAASLEDSSPRAQSWVGHKRKESAVQMLFSDPKNQSTTLTTSVNIVQARASTGTPKMPPKKRKKLGKDQTDHEVHRELKGQQLEDGCCWKLLNFEECLPGNAGHFTIGFPILSGELQLFVSVAIKKEKCAVEEVRLNRINPPERFQRRFNKRCPVFFFACKTLSSYITHEMAKMKSLEELPWYLDFFNSFARRVNAISEEVVTALEGCGGSRLKGNVFSFNMLSLPLLINCTVDIDLLQVVQLGGPCLKFRPTMGHLDEREVSLLVSHLWKGSTPLLTSIKGAYKHLFSLEIKDGGTITRRAPLLF